MVDGYQMVSRKKAEIFGDACRSTLKKIYAGLSMYEQRLKIGE